MKADVGWVDQLSHRRGGSEGRTERSGRRARLGREVRGAEALGPMKMKCWRGQKSRMPLGLSLKMTGTELSAVGLGLAKRVRPSGLLKDDANRNSQLLGALSICPAMFQGFPGLISVHPHNSSARRWWYCSNFL